MNATVTGWYEGDCPQTGARLRLPRTREAEAIAQKLMQDLKPKSQDPKEIFNKEIFNREGKMYGILLAEGPEGNRQILKAFSGLLDGQSERLGWVSPIPGREQVALLEARTLAQLEDLKQRIIALKQIPEREQLVEQSQIFEQRLAAMAAMHRDRKKQRQALRQALHQALCQSVPQSVQQYLETLDEASRRDGMERRDLKRERKAVLAPLQTAIAQADAQIRQLKQRRKTLSRQLQAQMHAAYSITNFGGESRSLADLMPGGLPTGTGDCCAPKLLHAAAQQCLTPIAMAEFWWGPSLGDKVQGQFYGPCQERCQPIMGFLLRGLGHRSFAQASQAQASSVQVSQAEASSKVQISSSSPISSPTSSPITILFEDDWLLAIDKPAGLLSVPGRTGDRQDSVLSRLRNLYATGSSLKPIHRLDQATSGILLFAKDSETHRQLNQQFAERAVAKVYEAILTGTVLIREGQIDLPLWGDPGDRPRQSVHWEQGKPSLTEFHVLETAVKLEEYPELSDRAHTRLKLIPQTGRTHQLRVHLKEGLGMPILGDRLYGCTASVSRLHLHAKTLCFTHPRTHQWVEVRSSVPF